MTNTMISIERLSQKDLEPLKRFYLIALRRVMEKEGIEDIDQFVEEETREKMKFANLDIQSKGRDYFFLIAKRHQEILGTIAYGPAGDLIIEISKGALAEYGEIGSVFVHPDHQNKGIGSLMLNAMYLALLGKGINSFCLDSGYTIAKQIWTKKLGEPYLISKDQWGPGYDHYVWFKNMEDITISLNIN